MGLSIGSPSFQQLDFTFLAGEEQEFANFLERIKKDNKTQYHAAHLDDFEHFFQTILRVKEQQNIHNSALALLTMTKLAAERLDQLDAESDRVCEDEQRHCAAGG